MISNAYYELSKRLDEAEEELQSDPPNKESLLEAFQDAEDLLTQLDTVEHRLISEIQTARDGGPSEQ